jgi:transaldolase
MGVIDGVTTNPTLISRENRDFIPLIKEICEIFQGLPISLEVLSLKAEGMIEEARSIATPFMSWKQPLSERMWGRFLNNLSPLKTF